MTVKTFASSTGSTIGPVFASRRWRARDTMVSCDSRATDTHCAQHVVKGDVVNLVDAESGRTYVIDHIDTDDPDMDAFLVRLGAYSGESIKIVSKRRKTCIVVIKNSRYSIDRQLAQAVIVRG